jgi:hypothetical protein
MSGGRFLSRVARGATLVGLVGGVILSSGVASAETFADACGSITEHDLAKAFDKKDIHQHTNVLRAPGNSAGVLHLRCLVLAFTGARPSGAAREQRAIIDGRASKLRIETWVADEGTAAETWRANFPKKIEGLTSRARKQFLEVVPGGRQIKLPRFGVEHSLAFIATTGSLVKLRALWWSPSAASIVSMSAVEAKGSPLSASIRRVAGVVVPVIH